MASAFNRMSCEHSNVLVNPRTIPPKKDRCVVSQTNRRPSARLTVVMPCVDQSCLSSSQKAHEMSSLRLACKVIRMGSARPLTSRALLLDSDLSPMLMAARTASGPPAPSLLSEVPLLMLTRLDGSKAVMVMARLSTPRFLMTEAGTTTSTSVPSTGTARLPPASSTAATLSLTAVTVAPATLMVVLLSLPSMSSARMAISRASAAFNKTWACGGGTRDVPVVLDTVVTVVVETVLV
mmetsp:Transcript_113143/g.330713  ORF Transcript_113143/g.330713 Transcript_113143/m.330713 type:complete len:237 (-) Transcript_113143:186-896(-)